MSRANASPEAGFLTDAEVVERVLRGEVDAFQLLVRRHQAAAFRLCNAIVLDTDAAADLVQDSFVRAYVHLARCKEPDRFRMWLLRTARNRALDYLRERRRSDVSLSDARVLHHVDATTHVEGPDVQRIHDRGAIQAALERLSQPLREAFVLRFVEGMSTEEVADLLGTGLSAVKMRVQRARLQLQDLLRERESARDVTGGGRPSSDA